MSLLSRAVPSAPPFRSQFPPLFSYFSNSPILYRRERDGDIVNKDPDGPHRLLVVQPRLRPETHLKAKLEEALNLANSLEQPRYGFYETEFLDKEIPPHIVVQDPLAKSPRADTLFGAGTVSTIKCHVNNLESKDGVDSIFVNTILTGVQQRNLERAWRKPVLDRVGLIIEIFNAHAQTKEAKLQAELAALMYKRSRLVRIRGADGRSTFGGIGEAEVVSARGRGSGGRGFISGAGETELQLQRRRILDRRKKLLSEIKEVRRTRAVQRAARRSGGERIATIAIVGYTNAGKSTLASALSQRDHYCDDRLFATVDPKLSSVVLPSGRDALLSDTVGFISDLPVQLVEAFHATLEEVVEADLLVHVLDSSAPNLNEHQETVYGVLRKIGVSKEKIENMIEVWNKVDLQENEFEINNLDEEDYFSSVSGEEDTDIASEHFSGQDVDHGLEEYSSDETELSGDLEEAVCDEEDYSNDWLSRDDEQDWCVDNDGCSIGREIVGGESLEDDWKAASQQEFTGHVKTSAVTGVGLQELLELIDEKLGPYQVVERNSIFDRKWRPPRKEENEVAI